VIFTIFWLFISLFCGFSLESLGFLTVLAFLAASGLFEFFSSFRLFSGFSRFLTVLGCFYHFLQIQTIFGHF